MFAMRLFKSRGSSHINVAGVLVGLLNETSSKRYQDLVLLAYESIRFLRL